MPFKEELEYYCGDCKTRFKRVALAGHFPDKGCPKCGELPGDYNVINAWYEQVRGSKKKIYSIKDGKQVK